MKLGKNALVLGFSVLLVAFSVFVIQKRSKEQKQTDEDSNKPDQKSIVDNRGPSLTPVAKEQKKGKALQSGEVRLRFDLSKHPFSSQKAADFYYSEYKKLLFPDMPDPSSWIDPILKDLAEKKNLNLTLGQVGRLEVVEAVPLLLDLLKSSENSDIKRISAELLTQFGRKEGIDYFLENYGNKEMMLHQALFDAITFYDRKKYLPQIDRMLNKESQKGQWHGLSLARIIAHFRNESSLDYYLPRLNKHINFDDKDLALLGNIKDDRLVAPLKRQFDQSTKTWAKVAAAYALAKQVGGEYEDFVVDKALASLEMPNARKEPEKYQEWRQKNGGNSGTGVSQAVSYLPELGTEKAVAALEQISEARNNYSKNAIIGLAKIETRESRDALVRLGQQELVRESSEGIYLGNYLAKALSLYDDSEANALASSLFKWEKGKNLSFFLAETKGSAGLFDERIKRW